MCIKHSEDKVCSCPSVALKTTPVFFLSIEKKNRAGKKTVMVFSSVRGPGLPLDKSSPQCPGHIRWGSSILSATCRVLRHGGGGGRYGHVRSLALAPAASLPQIQIVIKQCGTLCPEISHLVRASVQACRRRSAAE